MIEHHFIILMIQKKSFVMLFHSHSLSFSVLFDCYKRFFYRMFFTNVLTTTIKEVIMADFQNTSKMNEWKKNALVRKKLELCYFQTTHLYNWFEESERDGETATTASTIVKIVHDAHKHLHIQAWDEVVKKEKNREECNCSQYASNTTSLEKYVAVIRARHGSFRHKHIFASQLEWKAKQIKPKM